MLQTSNDLAAKSDKFWNKKSDELAAMSDKFEYILKLEKLSDVYNNDFDVSKVKQTSHVW